VTCDRFELIVRTWMQFRYFYGMSYKLLTCVDVYVYGGGEQGIMGLWSGVLSINIHNTATSGKQLSVGYK